MSQGKLSAEQRRAQELTTEVTELSSRCRGLESALTTARAEGERAAKRVESLMAQQAATSKQLEEVREDEGVHGWRGWRAKVHSKDTLSMTMGRG